MIYVDLVCLPGFQNSKQKCRGVCVEGGIGLPKHFPSFFCAQGLDVDSALLQDIWHDIILSAFLNPNLLDTNEFHLALSINRNV